MAHGVGQNWLMVVGNCRVALRVLSPVACLHAEGRGSEGSASEFSVEELSIGIGHIRAMCRLTGNSDVPLPRRQLEPENGGAGTLWEMPQRQSKRGPMVHTKLKMGLLPRIESCSPCAPASLAPIQ